MIDTLALLTQRFGRRAGNMKMATLATYFGLGQQSHRSLDDLRMDLEVVKYCATVLFLESSLPDILTENNQVSPNATTRSPSNGQFSPEGMALNSSTSTANIKFENYNLSATSQSIEGNHPTLALVTPNPLDEVPHHAEPITPQRDPFDMGPLNDEVDRSSLPSDDSMDEESGSGSGSPESSTAAKPEGPSGCSDFLEPKVVSVPSISVSLAPFYRGPQKMQILHKDNVLQICCTKLKVRFNISSKFVDHAGRPRLSFVVDATPSICGIWDKCDSLAQRFYAESGSSSEWRSVVTRNVRGD